MVATAARAANPSLEGRTGWTAVLGGPNGAHDSAADAPRVVAEGDLVGDAGHGSLYVAYDGAETETVADDRLRFRVRMGSTAPLTGWNGMAVVGLDANADGRIDLLMAWDGNGGSPQVRLLDPGTGLSRSPNTTLTTLLPAGWLPSAGVYPATSEVVQIQSVSATNDPQWDGSADVGAHAGADSFISWRVPVPDLVATLAKPSPVDAQGQTGPRGSTGIGGVGLTTPVRYIAFTQTGLGALNGDLSGVGSSFDRNASWSDLGAFSAAAPLAEPRGLFSEVRIHQPVDPSGTLNQSEDAAVALTGNAPPLGWVKITVADSGSGLQTAWVQADALGQWHSAQNLASLGQGELTLTAESVVGTGSSGILSGTAPATATVLHDRQAPLLTVLPLDTQGTPTISGSSDLPNGSVVTVEIDHDHLPETLPITYRALVQSGAWSVSTATALPASGSWPVGGITRTARITATATDAAGNLQTAVAITRPTVQPVVSRSLSPTLTGTWVKESSDLLQVTVGGATYALSPAGDAWSLNLATATPTQGSLALSVGAAQQVQAQVTRAGVSVDDATTGELTLLPPVTVSVDGGAVVSGAGLWPVLSGGSSGAGGFVIVRINPGNDANLTDVVNYSAATDVSGRWTVNTLSASPISGSANSATGFLGVNGIQVFDAQAVTSVAQVLTQSNPVLTIDSIRSEAVTDTLALVNNAGAGASWLNGTEDNQVRVSGSATGSGTVDLTIADPLGRGLRITDLPITAGTWTTSALNLSSLEEGVLTVTATIRGTSVTVVNTSVTHDAWAPRIAITTPSQLKKNSVSFITGVSELSLKSLTVTIRNSADTANLAGPATVNTLASGNFSASLDPGNINDGIIKVATTTQETDAAGNIVQAVQKIQSLSNFNPTRTLSFQTIATDQKISSSEITSGLPIAGGTTLTGTGTVTLQVTDGLVTNTVSGPYSGSSWTAALSDSQVRSLANGLLTFTVSAADGSALINSAAFAQLELTPPQLTITDNVPGTASGAVTFSFTFSESVSGFDTTDITVVGGTKGVFTPLTGTTYSLVVQPNSSSYGTLEISVPDRAAASLVGSRGSAPGFATQAYDTRPSVVVPTLTIDTSELAVDTTPSFSGTTSLPAGLPVQIQIDTDNDGVNDVFYDAPALTTGRWVLEAGTDVPSSGVFPASGLSPSARITAIAERLYYGTTSVTGLNRPTVQSVNTSSRRPGLSGAWTQISGDSLQVSVGAQVYSGSSLTINDTHWSLTVDSDLSDGVYEVLASVTRSGGGVAQDPSSNELTVDTTAVITIAGGVSLDETADTTPVISGTTSGISAGTLVDLVLDPEEGSMVNLRYQIPVGSDGRWSADTGVLVPFSGNFPAEGLQGWIQLSASVTDAAGNSANDLQRLRVDGTAPFLTFTFNPLTATPMPWITGVSDLAAGAIVLVSVDPNNDGDWADAITVNATVGSVGAWRAQITSPISGTVGVRAQAEDEVGNVFVTPVKLLRVDSSAPALILNPLPSGPGQVYADERVDESEDQALGISGSTAAWTPGAVVQVSLTDETQTLNSSALVQSDGSWTTPALNLRGLAYGTIWVSAWATAPDRSVFTANESFIHGRTTFASPTLDGITDDTGLRGDFITSDSSVLVRGTGVAGGTVSVSVWTPAGAEVVPVTGVGVAADGTWTLALNPLPDGQYTLRASSTRGIVEQALVIDSNVPQGPVTVDSQITDLATPVITGQVTVEADDVFTVLLDGVTYQPGDGYLSVSGQVWSLSVPERNALLPAAMDGGFSGVYDVVTTLRDIAGNARSDSTSGELTIRDDQLPILDLAPSDPLSVASTVVVPPGQEISLAGGIPSAVLSDNSGRIRALTLAATDLQDGTSELLLLGNTSFPADGSSGASRVIQVGAFSVDVWFGSGRFWIFKTDRPTFSVSEAQSVVRAIRYSNTRSVVTPGSRRFDLSATDDAGNVSATATVTCLVPGPVARFQVTAASDQVVVGGTVVITAQAVDASGVRVLAAGRRVVWTQSGTPGVLSVATGTVDAEGQASVILSVPTSSGSSTQVTATDPDLPVIMGTSAQVITVAGAAHQLAFQTQPSDTVAGTSIQPSPVVEIQDTYGNRIESFTGVVTLNWEAAASGLTLPSATSRVASNGWVTFDEIRPTVAAVGYTLRASSGSLILVTSQAFAVVPAGADAALSSLSPLTASIPADGVATQRLSVQVRDAFGNTLMTGGASIAFSRTAGLGSLSSVEYLGNGTFAATVTAPTVSGTGSFVANIAGQPVLSGNVSPTVAQIEYRDVTAPVISGLVAPLVVENTTAIATYTANESVTWSLNGGADAARFTLSGGVLSFASAPDFEVPADANTDNSYLVVIRATDTAGNTTDQSLIVTVTDADEVAPVISGLIAPSVEENTTAIATYTANETVTWNLNGGADAARFTLNAGVLAFASAPNFEAPVDANTDNVYNVVIRATDTAGNTADQSITVTVTDADEIAPVISGSFAPSVVENTTVIAGPSAQSFVETVTGIATYTANEPVVWSINSGVDADHFILTGGTLSFIRNTDFEAPADSDGNNNYFVVVRATDIAGNTTDHSITVTVTDANEAPALVDLNGLTLPENARSGLVLGQLRGTDPDRGDSLQYRLVTGVADNASFEVQGDRLLSKRPLDFETQRQYRLRVSVTDRGGLSTEREVLVSVTDENDPPRRASEIEGLSGVYREAFQWAVPATAFTDPDAGQTLRLTLSGLPRGLIFDPLNRTVRGVPEQVGSYSLTLSARDSGIPSATVSAQVRLVILPAQARLSVVDWEQTYDGRPKPVHVVTQPGDLRVFVTYAGSDTPPTLPGNYPVVAFVRDPNVAGSISGLLTVSRPRYSLRLNPAYPTILEDAPAKGRVISPGDAMVKVRRQDGSDLSLDLLHSLGLTVRLIFNSVPLDEHGNVCGSLQRLRGGVWSQVTPSLENLIDVSAEELELGRWMYVPDSGKSGLRPAYLPFDAELVDSLGVQITYATGGQIHLLLRERLVAVPDSLNRSTQPIQRWRTSELLQNDVVSDGGVDVQIPGGRSEQGGVIAVEGEWVVYRPASDLPEGAVDRFSYEIRQGGETARASVLLMAQPWTTGTQKSAAQLLPSERGIQLRFRAQPSHRFRVLSSASLQAPLVWEELGQADSDSEGRLMWLAPVHLSAQQFYRIEPLP